MLEPRVHSLGDSAITIELGTERSPQLLGDVHAAAATIRNAALEHVHDVVPAYLALTVFYDPLQRTFSEMAGRILEVLTTAGSARPAQTSRHHLIPVRYDGMDIQTVAASTSLTVEQVIEIHSARTYTVDVLGFVPGFAYLSELDPRLSIARRSQPRPRVAAGSVAIAATFTGVYPLDTPGGWHIIGRTETVMFDAHRESPALFKAGDTVRFERAP